MTTSKATEPGSTRAQTLSRLAALMTACALTACGGGGGDAGTTFPPPPSPAPATGAQACSPNNPYRGDATAPTAIGSLSAEKAWLRGYFDQAYLWYSEVPVVNASAPAYSNDTSTGYEGSISAYFDALLTPAVTPSGKLKDQFSFTYPTKAWNDLSQSGVSLGYGIEWTFKSATPPRQIRIAYVEPNSAAANAGLLRGDTLVSISSGGTTVSADDGTAAGVNLLNAALFPRTAGTFSFVFSRNGNNLPTNTFTAQAVTKTPVLDTRVLTAPDNSKVGYIVFNDHIAPSEAQLISSITSLRDQGVSDLVLDLRYNGGGYLFIASELSYMIAGPSRTYNGTASKTFEKLQYNNKRVADNAQPPTPFYNQSCILNANFQCTNEQPLPTLNLGRVYVLTSGSTCSASESIINGLRGVDVQVNVIGTTTCGKPYGFTAKDNCGMSYFPIEFQGVNAKGFGDYADGFTTNCMAGDDLNKPLGDATEAKLATALYLRANGSCPSPALGKLAKPSEALSDGFMLRGPARENRIHTEPRR